jgi:hypothetical protein
VRTAKLIADTETASTVLRLMMALNDIAMANEGLREWTVTEERRKQARQNGGRLYYGRMLMAHVYEALSIIEDIQDSAKLKAQVDACDPATRSSFLEDRRLRHAPPHPEQRVVPLRRQACPAGSTADRQEVFGPPLYLLARA